MRPRLPRLAAPRAGHAKQKGWAQLPAGAPAQAWSLVHLGRSRIPTSQPLGTAWSQEVQRGPGPDARGWGQQESYRGLPDLTGSWSGDP